MSVGQRKAKKYFYFGRETSRAIMPPSFTIAERIPVWLALSEFYLDTELQEADFEHIATVIKRSPYTLAEAKQIDKYELFPVLQANLLSVAGVWDGFDEDWLIEAATKQAKRPTWAKQIAVTPFHRLFRWMTADYWQQLEAKFG